MSQELIYILMGVLSAAVAIFYTKKQLSSKRLKDIEELVLMNNRLLGFLAETLAPITHMVENSQQELNEDLLSELVKHSAELEKWGKT